MTDKDVCFDEEGGVNFIILVFTAANQLFCFRQLFSFKGNASTLQRESRKMFSLNT